VDGAILSVTLVIIHLTFGQHIVNDTSNYSYNYNLGGSITNLNNNSVNNYVVAPEAVPNPLAIIEKGEQVLLAWQTILTRIM